MTLRPRQEWGCILWEPDVFGRTHLGAPLEVWRPAGPCRLLLFAGIHGEEAETVFALSRALRQLGERSPHAAVVLAANPDGLIRGTRGNAKGVELNRNFPTSDWRPDPVPHRSTLGDPRDVLLSPGGSPGSEPETQALIRLIGDLKPEAVVSLHAPLACVDDANASPLGKWIADRAGLPFVQDVGYPTPGSFGTWGREHGVPVVTYEFGMTNTDAIVRDHVPILVDLLTHWPLA